MGADGLRAIGEENSEIARLGFVGCPWTTSMYLMAGGTGDKEFHSTRAKVYSNQEDAMRVLLSVADAVGDLLADQVNHGGADAVQMFDTWAGLLSESDYRKYAKPATERAIEVFRSKANRRVPLSIMRKEVHICTMKSEPSTLMQCPLIGGMISKRIALSLASICLPRQP